MPRARPAGSRSSPTRRASSCSSPCAPTTSCTASRPTSSRYTQHNVTLEPDDAAIDEFFWDVNGTGWAQPFGRVRAEVRMSSDVVGAASPGDAPATAAGADRAPRASRSPRPTRHRPWSSPRRSALGPYENLTVAVGFDATARSSRATTRSGHRRRRSPARWRPRFAVLAMLAAIVLRVAPLARPPRPRHDHRAVRAARGHQRDGGRRPRRAPRARASRRRSSNGRSRASCASSRPGARSSRSSSSAGSSAIATRSPSCWRCISGNPVPGARRDLKSRDVTLGRRLLSLRQSVTKRVVQRNLRRRPDLVVAGAPRDRRDRRRRRSA